MNKGSSWLITGLLFTILWSSASTATKIALQDAQPLVVAVCRFGIAAAIMLFIAHALLKKRLPARKEMKQLAVYGLLKYHTPGHVCSSHEGGTASIGALTIAASPVFISFLLFYFKNQSAHVLLALFICVCGLW